MTTPPHRTAFSCNTFCLFWKYPRFVVLGQKGRRRRSCTYRCEWRLENGTRKTQVSRNLSHFLEENKQRRKHCALELWFKVRRCAYDPYGRIMWWRKNWGLRDPLGSSASWTVHGILSFAMHGPGSLRSLEPTLFSSPHDPYESQENLCGVISRLEFFWIESRNLQQCSDLVYSADAYDTI